MAASDSDSPGQPAEAVTPRLRVLRDAFEAEAEAHCTQGQHRQLRLRCARPIPTPGIAQCRAAAVNTAENGKKLYHSRFVLSNFVATCL
eukprot:3605177-Rhodomonas_salina.1